MENSRKTLATRRGMDAAKAARLAVCLLLLVALTMAMGCPCGTTSPSVAGKQTPRSDLRTTDDFGLPLVIHMETPDVPANIAKPSPPLPASKKAGPKRTPKAAPPKSPKPGPKKSP